MKKLIKAILVAVMMTTAGFAVAAAPAPVQTEQVNMVTENANTAPCLPVPLLAAAMKISDKAVIPANKILSVDVTLSFYIGKAYTGEQIEGYIYVLVAHTADGKTRPVGSAQIQDLPNMLPFLQMLEASHTPVNFFAGEFLTVDE